MFGDLSMERKLKMGSVHDLSKKGGTGSKRESSHLRWFATPPPVWPSLRTVSVDHKGRAGAADIWTSRVCDREC